MFDSFAKLARQNSLKNMIVNTKYQRLVIISGNYHV